MFPFEFEKVVQAIAFILRQCPGRRLDYTVLIKMLYMADRSSLEQIGRPITGDTIYAMPKGPVLSLVLYLIAGQDATAAHDAVGSRAAWEMCLRTWREVFLRKRGDLLLVGDASEDMLTIRDRELLQQHYTSLSKLTKDVVIDRMHKLREYEVAWRGKGNAKRALISVKDILRGCGADDGEISDVEEDARCDALIRSALVG